MRGMQVGGGKIVDYVWVVNNSFCNIFIAVMNAPNDVKSGG